MYDNNIKAGPKGTGLQGLTQDIHREWALKNMVMGLYIP